MSTKQINGQKNDVIGQKTAERAGDIQMRVQNAYFQNT